MSTPSSTPPPSNLPPKLDADGRPIPRTGSGSATAADGPYNHRHDEKLDYTSEHRDADTVVREEYVDNDDKALPTNKYLILALSAIATVLSILGIVFALGLEMDLVGFLFAIAGIVVAAIATVMGVNDARASPVLPALVTLVAVVVGVITLLDWMEADELAPATTGEVRGVNDGDIDNEALDGDAELGNTNLPATSDLQPEDDDEIDVE